MNWRFKEFLGLIAELLFMIVGGLLIFPSIFVIGFIYSFFKHMIFKFDYSVSRQLKPIIRSITLASDGLANSGAGELFNDVFRVKDDSYAKYGKWYQTISSVTGIRYKYQGNDTWLRRFLELFEKNHCVNAITDEELFYYNHKFASNSSVINLNDSNINISSVDSDVAIDSDDAVHPPKGALGGGKK